MRVVCCYRFSLEHQSAAENSPRQIFLRGLWSITVIHFLKIYVYSRSKSQKVSRDGLTCCYLVFSLDLFTLSFQWDRFILNVSLDLTCLYLSNTIKTPVQISVHHRVRIDVCQVKKRKSILWFFFSLLISKRPGIFTLQERRWWA